MGAGHPKALKCGASKQQFLSDAARELADSSEEWLGKGVLALESLVQQGELRLPARGEPSKARVCKRIARRPRDEELSASSQAGRSAGRMPSVDAAFGPYSVSFAGPDGDTECRPVDVVVVRGTITDQVPQGDQECRRLAHLVQQVSGSGAAEFEVSVRVEVGSVSFKKTVSPLRDGKYVEEKVKQMLEEQHKSGSSADLAFFASNYGNCIVSKVFCGGVVTLHFFKLTSRSGSRPPAGSDQVEMLVGRDKFIVTRSHRGGETAFPQPEGKRSTSMSLEQMEKDVKNWCKGMGVDGKGRGMPTSRNVGHAVRIKLLDLSKVEGLTVPGGMVRMDYDRTERLEHAREDLDREAKAKRSVAELRKAVDQAVECALDDERLEQLQVLLVQLESAAEALRVASEHQDPEALAVALERSQEAGLPEWEREAHEKADKELKVLQEKKQLARLEAVAGASEAPRIEDMVRIIVEAANENCAHLAPFDGAQLRLCEQIGVAADRARAGALSEEQAQSLSASLDQLPDISALARVGLAVSSFKEALAEMERKAQERRGLERKKTELEGSLRDILHNAESSPTDEAHYRDLAQTLRDAEGILGEEEVPSGSEGDAAAPEDSFRAMQRRAAAVLQEKRTMDQTVQLAEERLRQATLSDVMDPEGLEAVLVEIATKQQSGALHRAALSAPLLEAARRQLMAIRSPELELTLSQASAPGAATSGVSAELLAGARQQVRRLQMACRPTCDEECAELSRRFEEAQRNLEDELGRHKAQEEARERLRHCLRSSDPQLLEDALQHAQDCSIPEAHLQDHKARLHELRTAERQLQSALESGDRVHLSTAIEEATKQGLRTAAVDEAQQRLQSSKTHALVTAIRQRDYRALGKAIRDVDTWPPEEVEEVKDVLEQARAQYTELDSVAQAVSAALGSLGYEDLCNSVSEARRRNVKTEDVKKAEDMLDAMNDAIGKLRAAKDHQPRDLAALQEGLHHARQQGLQEQAVYKEAEEVFAGTCMPSAGMVWALDEQRAMWVVLCLRRPLNGSHGDPGAKENGTLHHVSHPFTVAVAELCHEAQISPEAEPYPVQYIHHALARIMHPRKGDVDAAAAPEGPSSLKELQGELWRALEDFSVDPTDGPPSAAEAIGSGSMVDAWQFNLVGVATRCAGLERLAHLLWFLVCIVEWETGQRLSLACMSEQARRTADLLNEAESVGRSLRTHLVALQARQGGAPSAEEEVGLPEAPAVIEARATALRGVLEEVEQAKREAERLQATIAKRRSTPEGVSDAAGETSPGGTPDLCWILDLLRQAKPRSLEEARVAVQVRQKEASGRAHDIFVDAYGLLEARLLQLQCKGRQVVDRESPMDMPPPQPVSAGKSAEPLLFEASVLPLTTFSSRIETASSLQDYSFLQLLGIPDAGRGPSQNIDRSFQRVEVYERFSENTGAVEDEFEDLCRLAVTEARQRCAGKRIVAALKPLLVDLVKRRQRISSMLNTLRNCGVDKIEKNLLRRHLQPRDLLIALTFSSMAPGPSQARMMSLAAKTDSPLPFLFGWAYSPPEAKAVAAAVTSASAEEAARRSGLQLCTQIHWGSLRELFGSPSHPLVLSLGTRMTLGKSYLLQYLYALQECHFRGSTQAPLRIHSMPSVDIIGDFAREEPLRGITLTDVHCYDPGEELCEALVATLASVATLVLLHISPAEDFVLEDGPSGCTANPSPALASLLQILALGGLAHARVVLLLRDADADDSGSVERRHMSACADTVLRSLENESRQFPGILAWSVPPLASLGPTELANEVTGLRKSRSLLTLEDDTTRPTLEDTLWQATKSKYKMPSMQVLQQRHQEFTVLLQQGGKRVPESQNGTTQERYGPLAQHVFQALGSIRSTRGLLGELFPVALCHQQLAALSQEKVRCISRGREYLEPEERRRLEVTVEELDKKMVALRRARQQAQPHALLRLFAQLVILGEGDRIVEFGTCLDEWKQARRAPLLEKKLRLRKELDELLQEKEQQESGAPPAGKGDGAAGADLGQINELRTELLALQRCLDEVDVSTDSFWLELMLWHELERVGARGGLAEIDKRLTFAASKACYLGWVKNGNPVHFLHSSPLQFGAFEPLRWHPQLSGASFFGSDFIGDVLRELDRDLGVDVRRRPLLVISIIGVQSSGKSTLMNYLFGCSFATHVGRCTKGLYISLLETKRELIVILDTEGLLSVEARDDVFDKQVALMTMACSDLVIVNNRGELGRHVGDLFQVCLFALYHLKLARISPAIGFVLQCLSMVNRQQQYEWVATVKKSLEESVQELQQKEKPHSFKLQDLVFLDSESIFVMPSAFNDDVQFGLQVSRPTNLYALKALQLREKVFRWIGRAKASQRQRLKETASNVVAATAPGSCFASLSQWYDHARTVWQTLSMCGTDLLQFRTMRQVLMAQQLQEFCDALVQKQVDGHLAEECERLIEQHSRELLAAGAAADVHAIDNAFRGQLEALRDAVLQEMQHEFDTFVRAHDSKFADEQVKSDKRFSLTGPMRRKYAAVDSLWRSQVHLALEQRSMDHLFEEVSVRVNELLLEQGASVNVQNVERVFEEKWGQVMAETLRKMRPNLERVMQEVVWHFNAALTNLKSQFRKAHIFHGVKSLSVHEMGSDSEVCSSFLHAKKGVGDALVPSMLPQVTSNLRGQVDTLWVKLVDVMRLEVDQQGQMSDAAALKILNRLNSEMEAGDQLRQLMHRLGSSFAHRLYFELAKATMQYRFQIEQQNFQARINEVLGKKQQKLWEIQARVDSGKREVHCAKVWAKTFVDALDQHFKNAVGRMAQEIVGHISSILTNPGNACELAIERSFTKRNWRHVVMYAIDPTQYLFMEFHKEWEHFKQALVDQYCQELKSNFGSCLRHAEERLQEMLVTGAFDGAGNMTMNRLSQELKKACESLADESLVSVLCGSLPTFSSDADWPLSNLEQFVQFASAELRHYRANVRQTEVTVERRMEVELTRQKANCWKCICGCPARCPGCGTKCNLEHENHWPERPHECRRHLYPAFNGWQKQEGRRPFLLHCRAKAQWQIARTRPPIEPGGPERYWENFQAMLEDEHPDWLDPVSRRPLSSMEPLEEYEEDCTTAPEGIQREIEENRRAWANCKDALLEHFTSMADDAEIEWLEKYKREGGALKAEDFADIRDELFAVTPLESLEYCLPCNVEDSVDQEGF